MVLLNVYDLSPVNDYLYAMGLGLHHSGVEILGKEYSFASGGGVFDSSPKDAPGAKFRGSIELGSFEGGSAEVSSAISDLREEFGPDRYNLIKRNCNHFANALVWRLLRRTIPGHVNRLANIGQCCSCLLPKKLLEESPVGPNSGGGGFQVYGRPEGKKNDSISTAAFSGKGATLGAQDSGSKVPLLGSWRGGGKKKDETLTDRREKARMAALARFEAKNAGSDRE